MPITVWLPPLTNLITAVCRPLKAEFEINIPQFCNPSSPICRIKFNRRPLAKLDRERNFSRHAYGRANASNPLAFSTSRIISFLELGVFIHEACMSMNFHAILVIRSIFQLQEMNLCGRKLHTIPYRHFRSRLARFTRRS